MEVRDISEPPATLEVDRGTLAFIALKAKAYSALVGSDDATDASDVADDRFVDALEDEADNPVARELSDAIDALNTDAKAALVALTWLGRGDYDAEEWDEALAAARERAHASTARYLMGVPLLGDHLENGADALGINLTADHEDGLGDPDLDTRGG